MNDTNQMGQGSVFWLIIRKSIPSMFSLLTIALYNFVDSIFVAQMGENALTAVSIAFPVQTLMISLADGSGIGAGSLISRHLGEGRDEEAREAANHALILSLLGFILYAALGLVCSDFYVSFFSNDSSTLKMAAEYSKIVSVGSVGVFVPIAYEKILQATGNMIIPMVALLIGTISNVLLDPIMIFGLFSFPALGVAGAAIASVISQLATLLFDFLYIKYSKFKLKTSLKHFRFRLNVIRDIYIVGLPSMLMQAINSFLVIFLNIILAGFGAAAIAVLGIYYKLKQFVYMPVYGLSQGVMPIMGYNFGAQNKMRLLSALKICFLLSVIIMGIGTIVFSLFPSILIRFFYPSDEMWIIGVPAFSIVGLSFCPAALNITLTTFFESIGNGKAGLILSILALNVLPVSYLLSRRDLSLFWYAFPISELICLLVGILLYFRVYRKTIRNLE